MKKLFLENLGLKIVSVLLAIVLWIFVTSRGQSEMSVDALVEFKNIPAGLEMVSSSVKIVSLNIKGQERLLKNVKPSDIRVYVDLSRAKKGETLYYINREDIQLPRSITVTNVNPSNLKVVTEETLTKTVRVLPVVTGLPEKGYQIKSIEVMPQYLVIEGIHSEVRKVITLKTEPIDITGYNESFSQTVKIDLTGRNVRSKTNEVTIKVIMGVKTL